MIAGAFLDAGDRGAEDWGEAEEGQLLENADRIRDDSLRDPDGRYPVEAVQLEKSGRAYSPEVGTLIILTQNLPGFTDNVSSFSSFPSATAERQ